MAAGRLVAGQMTVLSKHHGLGNDFLIAVEPSRALSATDALRWCERRRGIGADGLISADPLSSDGTLWSMSLWNADGSRAEISGNGIRCMAQAIVRRLGIEDRTVLNIRTAGGMREVEIWPDRRAGVHQAKVSMGKATEGPEPYDKWDLFGLTTDPADDRRHRQSPSRRGDRRSRPDRPGGDRTGDRDQLRRRHQCPSRPRG